MWRGVLALSVCALFLGPTTAVAADVPLAGVTLGASVSVLAQTLGPPANVTSGDSGNRFVFANGATAYVDDDGIVLAVATQTGSPRIEIDGVMRTFTVGTYSAATADAELADVAEFSTPGLRSYRLAPRRDLVLNFGGASNRLECVTYGEPGQLARLGLLPGDGAAKSITYHAPQLRRQTSPTAPVADTTVYRLTVDRVGVVRTVDVIIPTDATNAELERRQLLEAQHYSPATISGRPIAAVVFVELHH